MHHRQGDELVHLRRMSRMEHDTIKQADSLRVEILYFLYTLQGITIYPPDKAYLKMIFLFAQVGYVSFLEGMFYCLNLGISLLPFLAADFLIQSVP